MTNNPPPSPHPFDTYQCPECGNEILASVYQLISIDAPCPECGKRLVSEYGLRKGKESNERDN